MKSFLVKFEEKMFNALVSIKQETGVNITDIIRMSVINFINSYKQKKGDFNDLKK